MIAFSQPSLLWLLVLWALFALWFGGLQLRALGWVDRRVAPRFRRRFTVHDRRTMALHCALVTLLGVLLILAAAGPTLPGGTAPRGSGRLLVVIDGSASMYAEDVVVARPDEDPIGPRMELARQIAHRIVDELDGFQFALASFSGTAAIHLPMIDDRQLFAEALATLEPHTIYRNTGSSFASALDVAAHFLDPEVSDLQVVLLSDGEMPVPEPFDDSLAALAEVGVPIHAVAIGSEQGQGREIYDFRDVVAGVEEKRVLRAYTTRRVDGHLERMARETGGRFEVGTVETPARIARAVRASAAAGRAGARDDRLRRPIGWLPLTAFLVLFLVDALAIGRRRSLPPPAFDLDRIARPRSRAGAEAAPRALLALLLAFGATSCGSDADDLAHRENERGIALDLVGRHAAARPHYQRAAGLGVEPQIPTYNLARSVTLAGDFSEAHEIYQQALELDPDLVEAHYNDGVALYRWGAAERDPNNCDLERTRDLWTQARRRFSAARRLAEPGDENFRRASRNLEALRGQLAEIDRLRADPPPECRGAGGGGGGGGEPPQTSGGGTAGGASGDDPGPAGGSPPPELGPDDQETVAEALERIAAQRLEAGKYHRRTLPEQFRREDWSNPQAVILW